MPLKYIAVVCNNITTAEDIFRDTERQGLDPEAREVVQDMVDNLGIEQREVAATKEEKQLYVLQGQLLVLGDARTGKTSTVKALTGEEFKDDENETKGVEFKYVNQEWETLDLQDMQVGNFYQFAENIDIEEASWPPIFHQRRNTIRNDLKSFFGICCRSIINAFLLLHYSELKVVVWFTIFDMICLQIISNSIYFNFFPENFMVQWIQCLFYVLLFLRFFNPAADRRKLLGSLMDFFLLFHFAHSLLTTLTTRNLRTVDLQMLFLCDCPNETIVFSKVFHRCHLLYPLILVILPSFFLIICCLLVILVWPLLIMRGNVFKFHNLLIELQFKLVPLLIFHDVLPLWAEILSRILIIIRFGLFGRFCFFRYYTPTANGCFIFTLHLSLLYQQNILLKLYTGAALALELAIILQLRDIGLDSKVQLILLYAILVCVGTALHIYGRWLEVNDVSEDRIIKFFGRDPTIYSIVILKFSPNMQKLKANFCKLKIKILDFAGGEEYYAYHQIFLNTNAIYAIVFNIQECIKDNFKDIETKVRRLQFWLESIYCHVPQGTRAHIFLVGTHRADIEMDTLRVINTYIYKALGHLFIDEIFLNVEDDLMFFHVENSRGVNDNGVISLRKKIRSVAEDELKDVMGQEIPLSWIKVQDIIIRYQKNRQRPACLTVQEFKEAFDHLYITWSEDMLRYFHEKGFIIHLDKNKNEGLSKWVLLDPDVLVQIVILLINQPEELTNKRGFRRHWTILKKSGMITKDLLHFIVSHATGNQETEESALITFMEEYDLICPLKDQFRDMQHLPDIKQITHLVPSLLPAAPDSQTIWLESIEDVKFYIFFDSYVPDAFFFRLLSRSCKASYDGIESYEPQIYRDCGVFLYSQQIYRLRIMKDEGLIEVTLTKPTGFLKPYDILLAIATRVEDIRNCDFHNVFFHCGPECSSPVCPGSSTDSTSLLTGQPRRHVYNVYPACKQKGPKCFQDFFKCQNGFREDAEIWMTPPRNRGPKEGLR